MPLDGAEAASRMMSLAGMANPMRGIPIIGGSGGSSLSAVPGSPGYADRINTGDPDEDILDLDPRADPTMLRQSGLLPTNVSPTFSRDFGTLVGPTSPGRPEYRVLVTYRRLTDGVTFSVVTSDLSDVKAIACVDWETAKALAPLLRVLAAVVDLTGEMPNAADGHTQVEAASGSLGSSPASDANSSRPASRARSRAKAAGGAAGG